MPLYRIDRKWRGEQVAMLDPIYPAGCALRYEQPLEWPPAPEMRDGWFPGLPYPLDDMRPQGSCPERKASRRWLPAASMAGS